MASKVDASSHPTPATLEDQFPELLKRDDELRAAERTALFGPNAKPIAKLQGRALAFSGGGIRSASFGLGVLQGFLNEDCFKRLNYLSTVSGGGYLGSAISWLKRETARASPSDADGAFQREFGWAGAGARRCARTQATASTPEAKPKNVWLDYVRQHGNYLKPGSITTIALIATALRGALFNLAVYGLMLIAVMALLVYTAFLPDASSAVSFLSPPWYRIESWLLLFGGLFALTVMLFGVATWVSSKPPLLAGAVGLATVLLLLAAGIVSLTGIGLSAPLDADSLNWRWPAATAAFLTCAVGISFLVKLIAYRSHARRKASAVWPYLSRVGYLKYLGDFLTISLGLLVLWLIPYADHWVDQKLSSLLAGGASTLLGALGALKQFSAGRDKEAVTSPLANLRIVASAVLLIYGLLLLAHHVAIAVGHSWSYGLIAALAVIAFVVGLLVNTNYYGLGRMYRDRLMEAFMPNLSTIDDNTWAPATDADGARLVDFRGAQGAVQQPLHLVNCNVVMVDATSDTFRGRGGDSFVLSALFSGSNATGWVPTGKLGDGKMSLATAMAISGAAANPNAGVAGRGITRNRLVSLLMSLLGIRLGHWQPNPNHPGWVRTYAPNLWRPGLRQGLLGRGLNEKAAYVELTDGGHFDNTGLYELIRRRAEFIVLCEAGQDAKYQMDDLANTIEKLRVDFGVHVRFEEKEFALEALRPTPTATGFSERGFAIGSIRYPTTRDASAEPKYDEGTIIYIQTTPVKNMRPDTDAYRRQNPDFPHETTADQFFAEEQLEAYRELGLRIARDMLDVVKAGGQSTCVPLKRAYQALFAPQPADAKTN